MSTIPKDNLYTRDHEWVRIEGNKAEVGITDHAQKALGTSFLLNCLTLKTKLMPEMSLVQ